MQHVEIRMGGFCTWKLPIMAATKMRNLYHKDICKSTRENLRFKDSSHDEILSGRLKLACRQPTAQSKRALHQKPQTWFALSPQTKLTYHQHYIALLKTRPLL